MYLARENTSAKFRSKPGSNLRPQRDSFTALRLHHDCIYYIPILEIDINEKIWRKRKAVKIKNKF